MSPTASQPIPLGNIDKLEVFQRCKPILVTNFTSYVIFDNDYFVKVLEGGNDHTTMPNDARIRAMEHEIRMMEVAGEDCAFQPLGKVLLSGAVVGYITHLGVSITKYIPEYFSEKETLLGGHSFTLPTTKTLTDGLASLVRRLHNKGVLHGDIKCSNLLYSRQACGLLFCDFGSANLNTSKDKIVSMTPQYSTPARARGGPMVQTPLCKEDDLYATGITLWEIGASDNAPFPFHDIDDDDYVDDIVMAGFQPNMYLVEDLPTRQLIRSFLEEGSPTFGPSITRTVCIMATVAYADCTSVLPHTYSKTVHHEACKRAEECNADLVYHPPSTLSHAENLHCETCL